MLGDIYKQAQHTSLKATNKLHTAAQAWNALGHGAQALTETVTEILPVDIPYSLPNATELIQILGDKAGLASKLQEITPPGIENITQGFKGGYDFLKDGVTQASDLSSEVLGVGIDTVKHMYGNVLPHLPKSELIEGIGEFAKGVTDNPIVQKFTEHVPGINSALYVAKRVSNCVAHCLDGNGVKGIARETIALSVELATINAFPLATSVASTVRFGANIAAKKGIDLPLARTDMIAAIADKFADACMSVASNCTPVIGNVLRTTSKVAKETSVSMVKGTVEFTKNMPEQMSNLMQAKNDAIIQAQVALLDKQEKLANAYSVLHEKTSQLSHFICKKTGLDPEAKRTEMSTMILEGKIAVMDIPRQVKDQASKICARNEQLNGLKETLDINMAKVREMGDKFLDRITEMARGMELGEKIKPSLNMITAKMQEIAGMMSIEQQAQKGAAVAGR